VGRRRRLVCPVEVLDELARRRDCGIVSVAVVGVALDGGIEPTVRHAADLGYLPIVVTDACGAGDHGAGERALATRASTGDALLTDAAAFARALARP
jgi:biuret amidohydrolase